LRFVPLSISQHAENGPTCGFNVCFANACDQFFASARAGSMDDSEAQPT
jgi:hypothetical protein